MRSSVTGGIETLEFNIPSDPDHLAILEAVIEVGNPARCSGVREDTRSGGRAQGFVAADVIAMLVGVEDVRDRPAALPRPREAERPVERIDGESLAGEFAGDEIVEVAPGVTWPKALDDHRDSIRSLRAAIPVAGTLQPVA